MAQVSWFEHEIDAQTTTPAILGARLAGEQHQVVSFRQLRDLGAGRGWIQHAVRAKRLFAIHKGVYAWGHPDLRREGFLIAAVLACGEGALLSHRTALVHRGLIQSASRTIHVTVPGSNKPEVEGVTVHLTRHLTEADRALVGGIPVTSVARTLVDFAGIARPRELIQAIEQAERLRVFDLRAVEETLERSNGRRGAKALRKALKELHGEPPPDLRSPLEDRFRNYCKARKLPTPAFNVLIAGFLIDAVWEEQKVVVELDSRRHHMGIAEFESDRKRDTKLQMAGYRIARVTDHRLKREADELEADLRSLLA
jgi:very-short-patch-repair endonuclease/predicted transcriptional regulator of viral defense system